VLEALLPEHTRQLLENYQNMFSLLTSQLRWLYFDDLSRLVTRVDDGWIRVRIDTTSALDINLVEILRELSWTFYSVGEVGRNLDLLKNALASVGTDKLRATVVDALPLSPFNLTQIGGTSLTGRDWSQDFAKLQNLDAALSSRASESTLSAIAGALASRATDKLRVSVVDSLPRSPFTLYDSAGNELSSYVKNMDTALSSFTGSAGSSPPSKAIPILGFDGTYLRLLKTTSDGKLLAVLG